MFFVESFKVISRWSLEKEMFVVSFFFVGKYMQLSWSCLLIFNNINFLINYQVVGFIVKFAHPC